MTQHQHQLLGDGSSTGAVTCAPDEQVSGQQEWTARVDSKSGQQDGTARVDSKTGQQEWTARVDSKSGQHEWTARVDSKRGQEWTARVDSRQANVVAEVQLAHEALFDPAGRDGPCQLVVM